jgi:sugar lactone lactonase YvrE
LTGKPTPNGGCSFSGSATAPAGSGGIVEEETAYNPVTCQQTVARMSVTSTQLAQLEAKSSTPKTPSETAESIQTAEGVPAPSEPHTSGAQAVTPDVVTYYKSAHTKTLWVDPLGITITSLVADLSWPLYGPNEPVNTAVYSYEFPFDNWSNTGPKGPYKNSVTGVANNEGTKGTVGTSSGWSDSAHEDFYNSDFELILTTILSPPVVFAACGLSYDEAHFHHNIKVYGYKNASMGYLWEDEASGGCANLVHHVNYVGWGWDGPETEYISYNEESGREEGVVPPTSPPAVTTESATGVEPNAATLRGSVNPGGSDAHYYFEYGTSTSYGSDAPTPPGSDAGSGRTSSTVDTNITGLRQGTTYHYRFVASNTNGTSYGADQSFMTPALKPSAVLLPNGSEDIYFRGENGAIWQATGSGGIIELGGSATGSPTAIALSSGEQDVYFAGTNGAIWRWYFNPTSKAWSLSQLGGVTAGEPAVAQADPYSVFFRQTEGCRSCIYQIYESNGSWLSRALGGDAQGNPVAAVTPTGEEQVFWTETGEHGNISEWSSSKPMSEAFEWHFAQDGGTATTEKPAAVVYPNGTESVYFQAREGCILCEDQLYWGGSSWETQWGSGQLAGSPVAIAESESSQRSYWRGSNGAIWYNYGNAADYPFAPVQIGGSATSNPSEIYNPGGTVPTSLYYVDSTLGLEDLYSQNNEWHFKQLCAWPCGQQGPQPPKVTHLSPGNGSGTGGTSVAISGSNFSEVKAVTFSGKNAKSFTVNSSSSITAVAPPGVGTINVTVTTGNGTSPTTGENLFTYSPYTTSAKPSAVLLSDGSEYVYYRGENGAIWQATSYGAVREIGGQAVGNPTAVALSSGEQDVYFTGTNGAIWRWYFNPTSQTWSQTQVGGVTAGEPAVSAGAPYSVYFRQTEGCRSCIYHSHLSSGSWVTEPLGGSAAGNPTVVTREGEEQVFWAENTEGAGTGGISEWYWNSGGWHFARVGGTPTTEKPTVALHSDGTESVFFRAREGCISCIDQLYGNNGKWEIQWIGGDAAGTPVTVDEGDYKANVYWRGNQNEIWDLFGVPTDPGSEWHFNDFGNDPAGDPAEVHNSGGNVSTSLYYIDETGGLTDDYLEGNEWHVKQMCAWPCAAQKPAAPASTWLPQLSTETPEQGIALTATIGEWAAEPSVSYGYKWQDCNGSGESCTNITGVTSSNYTPVAGDVGHTLRVVVTATNSGGSTAASSLASGVIPAGAPANTTLPASSPSTPTEGAAETATSGSWTNSPTSYAYQWRRCNGSGEGCTIISGATTSSHTSAAADVGHTLAVEVTAINGNGAASAVSAATGVVSGIAPSYVGSFGSEGSGNSQFNHPGDVAGDSKGNLWVLDRGNGRVEEFNGKGEYERAFGSSGSGNGQLTSPDGLAVDPKGNVWVVDTGDTRIEEFNEKGEYQKVVGSSGSGGGQFKTPEGIAVDTHNNVWVSDTGNGRLEEFNEKGEFLKAVGSKGSGAGQIGEPEGLAIAPNGNVWVTDWSNNRVDEFNEKGEYVTEFGSEGSGNGQFKQPYGIIVDINGNVWVADTHNYRVQEFNTKGEYVTQFGSKGTGAGQFSFSYPIGLTVNAKREIWVTDSSDNRIEQWK